MSDLRDLLKRVKALSSDFPKLTHTFNFMIGAVYSLREAHGKGHRHRATYDETDRTQHLRRLHVAIDAVAADATPEPVWIAGFFYNTAIMRIDACHERFLKAMLEAAGVKQQKPKKGEAKTEAWATQLERTLGLDPPLARQYLALVRQEVNKLKHKLYGQEPSHALARPEQNDLVNATAAIDELVALMERPEIRSRLAKLFAELPPP